MLMLSMNQFLAWNKLIPFNNYQLLKTVNRHVGLPWQVILMEQDQLFVPSEQH